jgi:iron-sulfur cluster assembly protein
MGSVSKRFKVMSVTDAAAARVRELIASSEKPLVGLRVGVKNGGCAGMSYTMEFAEAVAPHDEVVDDNGVRVLIDPKAVLFLLGARMDFRKERLSAGFVFDNPNETGSCGCGESVSITPAKAEDEHATA